MDNERKRLYIIMCTLAVAVVGLSIAYAAMSTQLSITMSQVSNEDIEWDVGFAPGTVNATAGGTSATGRSCGAATVTKTTVSVANSSLSKPDDSCTYALTIQNLGDINATLASIAPTQPQGITCSTASNSTMVCGNLTYKLTTDANGTAALAAGGALNAGASLPVYLVVKFTGTAPSSTAVTHTNARFTLTYNQA